MYMNEFGKLINSIVKLINTMNGNIYTLENRVKLLEMQNAELIHELNRHSMFINGIIESGDAKDIYWLDKK